jgi:1-acyl-sn-glycerol-3-phosphate acyltransferase
VLPPRWVRRIVLAPAVPVLTLLAVTSLPVVAIAAAFASIWLPGRWRPLRILWFTLVFLVVESLMLVWLLGLWVASGFGRRLPDERWQAAHYTAMRHYLDALVRTARRTFHLRFDLHPDDEGLGGERTGPRPPLLVFARHAGPGDSFLLVHALLQRGYRPRIVLRDALRWAPAIDVGLSRVPSFFVRRDAPRGTGTRAIDGLAAGLGPDDALVLFPEGRNFTPHRRLHSIAKLEELGQHDEAEQAREMRYVLTPRTGGALAALAGAPTADVVFVAHTGLEDLSSIVDVWRGIPMDSHIQVEAWRVTRADVPRVREAQDAWLQWWWRRIDAWLLERCGEEVIPDAIVEAVVESDVELPPAP